MAKLISITEAPASSVVFANNPIVFKATTYYTLKEDESFLRIICRATFKLENPLPYYTGSTVYTTELSQPVESMGTATFNLSEDAKTLIRKISSEVDMNDGNVFENYRILAEVTFEDVWIRDNQEISGVLVDLRPSARFYVVPGGLTDYEMLLNGPANLVELAGQGRAMTRKPDGGILYRGEKMIVPTMRCHQLIGEDVPTSTCNVTLTVEKEKVQEGVVISELIDRSFHVITGNSMDYQTADTSEGDFDGNFSFNSTLTGEITGFFRTNTHGVHFLRFINGFGAVENISVRAKDKLSYEVSGDTHSLVQGISTRPTDRRYATKSQPVGVYELSSGYVPKQWAEWYVQELLTSPRVWIQLGGKWVPALIESEDDCVIYDRTKPEMPHVDFTLRLAIDGVTGITW